ncbi:hypothetical protein [Paenibacillus sp. 1-18]|uniref:hypothetical protein n=1 Tax=Paenibacillus sp. 1-18 TaxID=1333846 RepID=UPI000470408D|nr:hypothetical protein [Paenibacillus sp. 1-18]
MMNSLDNWLGIDRNFNIFIGIATFLGFASAIVYTYFLGKIGKKDEYSIQIRLNVTNKMFITFIIMFTAFFLITPSEMVHFKQILSMCFSITFLVGAIFAAYYYVRDFRN